MSLTESQGREKPSFPGKEGEKRRDEPGREITHACGLGFLRAKSGSSLVFPAFACYNEGAILRYVGTTSDGMLIL